MEDPGAFEGELLEIEGGGPAGARPLEKVRDYYATTPGGLEEVALRDMQHHLKGLQGVRVERGGRHGRILFRYERSPARLLELRAVEGLFALLREVRGVTVGRPGLLRIAEQVAGADLAPGVALHDILHGVKPDPWFSLTCTAGRGRRFSASELRQVVQTVLVARYDLQTQGEGPPYPLYLQVEGGRALFGLRLSGRRMQARDYLRAGIPGSAEGPVAYCLALLARVDRRDVCLDPGCGAATTLIEAGLGFAPGALIGGDAVPEALEAARANAEAAGVAIEFRGWVDGRFDLPDASADKVLCALLPRKGAPGVPVPVGPPLFKEFARLLRPGRTAVLLTDRREAVEGALKAPGVALREVRRLPVRLKGLKAAIYVLKREKGG